LNAEVEEEGSARDHDDHHVLASGPEPERERARQEDERRVEEVLGADQGAQRREAKELEERDDLDAAVSVFGGGVGAGAYAAFATLEADG